jgi:proteasome lid subunit RPN8/RPN11
MVTKIRQVWVAPEALRTVLDAAGPDRREEPCGLLLGYRVPLGAEVLSAVPVRNAHPSPQRAFYMEPEDLVVAGRAGRAQGLDIVGFWHGHLAGPAWPGVLDEEGMRVVRGGDGLPQQVHLVVGKGTTGKRVVRAFREGRNSAKRVELHLMKRARGQRAAPAAPPPAAAPGPLA